jgi:Uma2 family endonuclease
MSTHNLALAGDTTEIYYPESDGQPMAETDIHRDLMAELIAELDDYFQDEPNVYVSGNLLLYYEKGNPKKNVAPDVFVVKGISKEQRRIYKLWEEGKAPDLVIELSSRKTWGDDLQKKWRLYARLGVQEYYLFDPEYDYLEPPFRAYWLEDGEYEEVEVQEGRVKSQALGLEIVDTGSTLRFFDPSTDAFLPTRDEIRRAHEQAEIRAAEAESRAAEAESHAASEVRARQRVESELARLQTELARLRKES